MGADIRFGDADGGIAEPRRELVVRHRPVDQPCEYFGEVGLRRDGRQAFAVTAQLLHDC
jgi:hypothetical protein